MSESQRIEHVLREEAPQVLGALVRRFGHFDVAEDAVQEALVAAYTQWPTEGIPEQPRSWLVRVGYRKMVDMLRFEGAARRREEAAYTAVPAPTVVDHDDSLNLILLCCHPRLSPSSQVALTLRAVGGLTTAEIASAYGVAETTMGTRISRSKKQIEKSGARFVLTDAVDLRDRLSAAMRVLYLIFNEGYTASAGGSLTRTDLTAEAIRLARMLLRVALDEPEVAGLLALMLLTDARRAARSGRDDELIPLDRQDRGSWDRDMIDEGTRLIEDAWRQGNVGSFQIQAAIAAVHANSTSQADTDWPQIAALYLGLEQVEPTAPVRLARVVAVAHAYGTDRGLALLDALDEKHHLRTDALTTRRTHAVRGHLLARAGDRDAAAEQFRKALSLTINSAEREYVERQLGASLRDRA